MELKAWVKERAGRGIELLKYLRSATGKPVTHAQLTGWTADKPSDPSVKSSWRPIPVQYAPAIEKFTKGEVMRWDACPDTWHLVWPELRRRPEAPSLETQVAVQV